MKTRSLIVMTIVAGFAGSALADGRITTNHQPTGSGGRYDGTDGSGGAFEFTPTTGSHANQNNSGYNGVLGGLGLTNSFYSFCMERTEGLGSPQFTEISTSSSGGGISGQDQSGTDPLDARTAVIYQEFRNDGNFGGVGNIGSSSVPVGQSLTSSVQHAIWFIEGELPSARVTRPPSRWSLGPRPRSTPALVSAMSGCFVCGRTSTPRRASILALARTGSPSFRFPLVRGPVSVRSLASHASVPSAAARTRRSDGLG